MGKVLQIAADSVALSSLQSVLLLSQGNKKTAGCKTVRCLRGRQTAIGRTFKITEKELKIMPENIAICLPVKIGLSHIVSIKEFLKRITADTV